MTAETTRYALKLPYLGSLILTDSLHGQIPGPKQFAPQDRPNSTIVFWTFRLMVGLGLLMVLLGVWSLWLRWRG
jgi:cytochrome bd ubiquinol oxidase subunit I